MQRRRLALLICALAWALPARAGRLEDAFRDFIDRMKAQGQGIDGLRQALNLREVRTPVLEPRVDQLPLGRPIIAVFVTPGCGGCEAALSHLRGRKLVHEVMDVSRSQTAREAYALVKGEGFPVLLVGARRMTGWNLRLFKQAVAADMQDAGSTLEGRGS